MPKTHIKIIKNSQVKQLDIPHAPGCYIFKNQTGEIIYVGKAGDLHKRVLSYWRQSAHHSPAKQKMLGEISAIEWIKTDSEIEAFLLEANLIKKHQPYYNVVMRDDKRHIYIKVSTEDEIPGLFATRKIDKAGKYYGPFVSTAAVRETLKTLRKIWPFCTMKKIQKKPCFYYQVRRCTGVCGSVINVNEYKDKIIKPILLFFEGKKNVVIKKMEVEIKALESVGKIEAAQAVRQSINYMQEVLKHTEIINLADKYRSDVVELAKIMGLPSVPIRIEGYDISNIFGQEAVGSMVVFKDGEPDPGSYRKFIIKKPENRAGDTQMLQEIFERRFARLDDINQTDAWPKPDLIIVDGGKQQINVLIKELKRKNLDIPAIAISKDKGLRSSAARDKLFFPGEKKPLELPLASPALHIIKRVRDEAHRFAISFHRQRKIKKIFE